MDASEPPHTHAGPGHRFAWRLAFGSLLTSAATMATLAPFAIGVLGPYVTSEFDLTNTSFGGLGTTFFALAGSGSLLAAFFIDRFDPRAMFRASFGISALSLVLIAVAPSYWPLAAAMAIGGAGAALLHPVTNLLIGLHLPAGTRGVIMGLKQSGVQLGAAFSGAVLPTAAMLIGWRTAFAGIGVLAATGILWALIVVPPTPNVVRQTARLRLRLTPLLRWLCPYALLMGIGASAFGMYIVLYAVEDLAMGFALAGLAATIAGLASVISRIVWAALAERLGAIAALMTALAALASGAIATLLAAATLEAAWLVWVAAVIFGASGTAWNGVAHLAVVQETEPAQTGQASSLLQFAFFSGLLIGPVAFGTILDHLDSYHTAWSAIVGIYVVATLIGWGWMKWARAAARA